MKKTTKLAKPRVKKVTRVKAIKVKSGVKAGPIGGCGC
jgi:hypothetical protein